MTINSLSQPKKRSRIFSHRIAAGAARWSASSSTRFWKSKICSNCAVCFEATWAWQECKASTDSIEVSRLTILKHFRQVIDHNSWSKMIIKIWRALYVACSMRQHKIDNLTKIRKPYWISLTQERQFVWRTWPQMRLKCQPERSKLAQIRLQLGKDRSL